MKSVFIFYISTILCLFIVGCSDDNPFEPQDSTPVDIPGSLKAIDFPTADGNSWRYVSADNHEYTARISGTKNVGGFTTRIMVTDSETPFDYIGSIYQHPVRKINFTKDVDSYTEYAFELWLDFLDDTFFQRYLPKRMVWSFPLYKDKEWIVSKFYTSPELTYTRKVISNSENLIVQAGNFSKVFYVEEYASSESSSDQLLIGKYWIAPNTGIIKYEFYNPLADANVGYELKEFKK